MNQPSGHQRQPPLPAGKRGLRRNSERVIDDDDDRRHAAHRIEAQHAPDFSSFRLEIHR
jgi:hypothetical protein